VEANFADPIFEVADEGWILTSVRETTFRRLAEPRKAIDVKNALLILFRTSFRGRALKGHVEERKRNDDCR
jgi:hypothetical protein